MTPDETTGNPPADVQGFGPDNAQRSDALLRDCAAYRRNIRTERFEYLSPLIEDITGFSPDELAGMNVESYLSRIHPEDALRMIFEFERIAEGARGVVEYRFLHKDGNYRWVADHAEMDAGANDEPNIRVGLIRDVTPNKLVCARTEPQSLGPSHPTARGSVARHARSWWTHGRYVAGIAGILALAGVVALTLDPARFLPQGPTKWDVPSPAPAVAPASADNESLVAEFEHRIAALTNQVATLTRRASGLEAQMRVITQRANRPVEPPMRRSPASAEPQVNTNANPPAVLAEHDEPTRRTPRVPLVEPSNGDVRAPEQHPVAAMTHGTPRRLPRWVDYLRSTQPDPNAHQPVAPDHSTDR